MYSDQADLDYSIRKTMDSLLVAFQFSNHRRYIYFEYIVREKKTIKEISSASPSTSNVMLQQREQVSLWRGLFLEI